MKTQSNLNKIFTPTFPCLLATILLAALPYSGYAHNKVVVIPLFGGDKAPQLQPTAPVTKVDLSQTDYTILTNTVMDKTTGLEWQRLDDNVARTWSQAYDYCLDLFLDSKFGWRLPDVFELQSIVDYDGSQPTIETVAFPNLTELSYWSATREAASWANAWDVDFNTGRVFSTPKASLNYVRCVRKGQ